MRKDPDMASAVAAIRTLLEFLKRDKGGFSHGGGWVQVQLDIWEIVNVVSLSGIFTEVPHDVRNLDFNDHFSISWICSI